MTTIPLHEWDRLCSEADQEMKASNGHQFCKILKTRCDRCGRSPKQKGQCPGWVNTFVDKLYTKVNDFLANSPTP